MSPEEIQDQLICRLTDAGDAFDQYNELLQMAAELDGLYESEQVESALVKGCQSQVWVLMEWIGGAPGRGFSLRGDSDTLMVRGVLRMLQLMFDGQDAAAIAESTVRFVDETELAAIFDDKRQAGVASIAGRIWDFANAALRDAQE